MVTTPSLIPPRTLRKIERLSGEERRIYVQELIGSYESKRTRIDKIARGLVKRYAEGQKAHFDSVIEELHTLMNS